MPKKQSSTTQYPPSKDFKRDNWSSKNWTQHDELGKTKAAKEPQTKWQGK